VVAVAVMVAVPWLQLRRVPVSVVTPSDHVALVTFDRGRRVRPGTASRIARRPLGEWHSFADMPSPDADTCRMAVSRSGDWTAQFIADRPSSVWVRGVPTAGVVTVARLFNRVVWVATGSGIAPCLPQLLCTRTPARLVWVTRDPERTYGPELVQEILAAQPDTILYDTDAHGHPDLAWLAHRVYRETGAEAVICVSNRQTTLRLVAQLRQWGVAAIGPIWDS
jgi:predicted ferric reductase